MSDTYGKDLGGPQMKLHIDKESELTATEQLREQIIFLISTGGISIGEEMPSVRGLARKLGVSINTVSKVYSGLASGGWLVARPGAHHTAVEGSSRNDLAFSGKSINDIIDQVIDLAVRNGYSLQQLTNQLRNRLLEQPPDHLLIVEPDSGIGVVMREEIGQRVGAKPPTCDLTTLQQNPALRVGALLIAPVYMLEKLGHFNVNRKRTIAVSYSPLDAIISTISRLQKPSMIGFVSVSAAGLKTVSGMAAPAISSRHSSHMFLLETPDPNQTGRLALRRFRAGDYRPTDILKGNGGTAAPNLSAIEKSIWQTNETVSASDLRCMDLLLLDSVAFKLVEHPQKIRYQLLSENSLEMIEAAARRLRKLARSGTLGARKQYP
jgi:GntR family transcriptional regulator